MTQEVKTIPAQNPTAEEMTELCASVNSQFGDQVTTVATPFHFRKSKDSETGEVSQRETLQLPIPAPNVEGVVAILEAGGKPLDLLLDSLKDVVIAQARQLITEDTELHAGNMPYDKLSWEFIANIPKASRSGGGIPKELWEAFAADYIEVMQEAAGKTVEAATNAARMLVGKFAACKTNAPVLEFLVGQLAIYAEASPNAETYEAILEYLIKRADTLLNVSDEDLLAAL